MCRILSVLGGVIVEYPRLILVYLSYTLSFVFFSVFAFLSMILSRDFIIYIYSIPSSCGKNQW